MKCKRCRAQVADDAETCPNCGQDLSSLRQLLKSFYEEETLPSEDSAPPARGSRQDRTSVKEEDPKFTQTPQFFPDLDPALEREEGFSLSGPLPVEETEEERDPAPFTESIPKGGFWRRCIAFVVDQVVLLLLVAIFAVLGLLTLEIALSDARQISFLRQAVFVFLPLFPLAVVLSLAYFTYFHGAWGQTVGKMLLGLRVVQDDGQPLTFSRSLARTLAYVLSALPIFLGFLWVGFTSNKRSWHDAISGTMVVRE